MSNIYLRKAYDVLRGHEAEMKSAANYLRLGAIERPVGEAMAFLENADACDREARECARAAEFISTRLPQRRSLEAA